MTKNNNSNNFDGKQKPLMLCAIMLIVALFLWVTYSFWGFWKNWQKPPQNIDADSYIDKAGLDEVKLILEQRK